MLSRGQAQELAPAANLDADWFDATGEPWRGSDGTWASRLEIKSQRGFECEALLGREARRLNGSRRAPKLAATVVERPEFELGDHGAVVA